MLVVICFCDKASVLSEKYVAQVSGATAYLGMRSGRPKKVLEISDGTPEIKSDRGRPKSAQAMAIRARIVLGCAQGVSNSGLRRNCTSRARRWVSGGNGIENSGSMDCWMSQGWAFLAKSATGKSRKW